MPSPCLTGKWFPSLSAAGEMSDFSMSSEKTDLNALKRFKIFCECGKALMEIRV